MGGKCTIRCAMISSRGPKSKRQHDHFLAANHKSLAGDMPFVPTSRVSGAIVLCTVGGAPPALSVWLQSACEALCMCRVVMHGCDRAWHADLDRGVDKKEK